MRTAAQSNAKALDLPYQQGHKILALDFWQQISNLNHFEGNVSLLSYITCENVGRVSETCARL